MSMWYCCQVHHVYFHEDADGEYGGTCPLCNMEVQLAELKVIVTGILSRTSTQEDENYEPLRDRALVALATLPGRRLETDSADLIRNFTQQIDRSTRALNSRPEAVDETR